MREIVRQYGRTLCISTVVAMLVFMLFYGNENGDGGLLGDIAKELTWDVPRVTDAAEAVSREEFMKEGTAVCVRTGLAAGGTYQVGDILVPAEGENGTVADGKVLAVERIYDAKSGEETSGNVSEETIGTSGSTVTFPVRGLYRLCVAVKDGEAGESLQYVYAAIEETSKGEQRK